MPSDYQVRDLSPFSGVHEDLVLVRELQLLPESRASVQSERYVVGASADLQSSLPDLRVSELRGH